MMMKRFFIIIVVISVISLLPVSSDATLVTIDEYIYQNYDEGSLVDTSVLFGTADFSYVGSTLIIILTNTSTASTGYEGSTNILTGIGFNLPEGMSIFEGTVHIADGSLPINFPDVIDGWDGEDLSMEWGYDNDPINGPFDNPDIISSTVDTVVSSMNSTSDSKFLSGSLLNPPVLDGPEMGLLSGFVEDGIAGGLFAIQDSVIISLELSGSYFGTDAEFISFIDSGDVVLSFGSPDIAVPEPGTILLLGSGLIGLVGFRRKIKRKK